MNFNYTPMEWTKDARCASYPNPDIWHYESSRNEDEKELIAWQVAEAKRLCAECPVIKECLAEGLKDENLVAGNVLSGSVWGGLMDGERLNIRHGRQTFTYRQERVLRNNVNKKIAILNQ